MRELSIAIEKAPAGLILMLGYLNTDTTNIIFSHEKKLLC